MPRVTDDDPLEPAIEARAAALFAAAERANHERQDRLFAGLMFFEWLACIAAVLWISPATWEGRASAVHPHVWTAMGLGGLSVAFPIFLAITRPAATTTRHVIAVGQMLMSALLIHVTGGRIETHFHVFGSLSSGSTASPATAPRSRSSSRAWTR